MAAADPRLPVRRLGSERERALRAILLGLGLGLALSALSRPDR